MLFHFLEMIPQDDTVVGGGGSPEPQMPLLYSASTSRFAGICTNHQLTASAVVTFNWTEGYFDSALHEHRIYQDNVLVATHGSSLQYVKQVTGSVENGGGSNWQSNWTFRVDIVRKSDSVVLATMSAPAFTQFYGICN